MTLSQLFQYIYRSSGLVQHGACGLSISSSNKAASRAANRPLVSSFIRHVFSLSASISVTTPVI